MQIAVVNGISVRFDICRETRTPGHLDKMDPVFV